jgi:dCMP deaminase
MRYAVVSYIPAIHQGYIDFFKKYPGTLYILDQELVAEVPRMDRDIRALKPAEIQSLLQGLKIFEDIIILNTSTLTQLQNESSPIVMPDEDVNRHFAEAYLLDKKVAFISMFLRWDKQISTKEFEVPPDRIISKNQADKEIMELAFKEAEKSPDWWRQIGAVIVQDGKPILIGYNTPISAKDYTLGAFGDPRSNFDAGIGFEISKILHAEAGVIAHAARQGIPLEGASLYITTFPCPVCAKSIAASGIKRIYYSNGYSLLDAEDILKSFGIEIVLVQ